MTSTETPITHQSSSSILPQSLPSSQSDTMSITMASSPPQRAPTASGSTPKQSTISKRQHAAQRARIVSLSKQLKTRLQYATFKVEHGWSKQSLSEVENLYYKQSKGSTSAPSQGNQGTQISPSARRKSTIPGTPNPPNKVTFTTTPDSSIKAIASHEQDVFGGLITPPASGGTLPSQVEREFFTNPSFASGLKGQRRSPTAGLEGKGANATNKGKSYADFWSKIGTANPSQTVERSQ